MTGGRGRPMGSKNKLPKRSWVYDQLLERDFDFINELVELYRICDPSQKIHLLTLFAEFVIPKQRPVDSDGDTAPPSLIDVTPAVSDEQLIMLAKRTFVQKDES